MRAPVLSLVIILLVAMVFSTSSLVYAQQTNILNPSPTSLNLIPGTPGSSIELYYWVVVDNIPQNTTTCVLHITGQSAFGLRPNVTELNGETFECNDQQEELSFRLPLTGYYTGGNGTVKFIYSAYLTFLDQSGNILGERYLNIRGLTITEVGVEVTPSPSVTNEVLAHYPTNPKPGDRVTFYTSGTVTFYVKTVGQADIPVTVTVVIKYSDITVMGSAQLGGGTTQQGIEVNGVMLTETVSYTVYSGPYNYTIAMGEVNLADSYEGEVVYGIISIRRPTMIPSPDEDGKNLTIFSFTSSSLININQITIYISPQGGTECTPVEGNLPIVITSDGSYSVRCKTPASKLTGTIQITIQANGDTDQVTIPFTAQAYATDISSFIAWLYMYTFFVMTFLSMVVIVLGFFLRNTQMLATATIALSATVLTFAIPLLMAVILQLLFSSAHLSNPTGLTSLNLYNLGYYVDKAISYTQSLALDYTERLNDVGDAILGIFAGASLLSIGANLIPFLKGAIERLGGMLMMITFLVYFGSAILKLMAILYPTLVSINLALLFFMAIAYAIMGGIQGNYSQALNSIVQLSFVILTVLLVPPILATIDTVKSNYGTWCLPLIDKCIPNPFFWIPATILQILIIVTVIYLSFNRVLALISGGGGGG